MDTEEHLNSGVLKIIEQMDAEIIYLQKVVDVLQRAVAMLRDEQPLAREFAGMFMTDVAATILRDHPDGLHYRDIARIAVERGYRSGNPRNPDNDIKKIRSSFSVLLRKNSERFEVNHGFFRLKPELVRESPESTGRELTR